MIHYHGGPIWPTSAAVPLWSRRHGMTSFEHPDQVALMFEVCQSAVIDNGAFSKWLEARKRLGISDDTPTDVYFNERGMANAVYSKWKQESRVDVHAYAAFVKQWDRHPAFDWCLIPDAIDGDEFENDAMIASWYAAGMRHGVPVWHLHESFERLERLCRSYERVALGSSGQWTTIGTESWWRRMDEVRDVVCDELGRPKVKLHGLRMLSPTVFSHIPLASADSTNVAANIGKDVKWKGTYQPLTPTQRALVLAERIEMHAAAVTWSKRHGVQQNLELIG